MKQFLLSAGLFISFLANSQSLILTQAAYEPVIGDTNRMYILDTSAFSSGLNVNSTGANHLWDYQALVSTNSLVTSVYLNTTAVSASSNFPGSSMVQKQGPLNNFLKSTTTPTTQTEFLGINSPGITMNFTNSAVMVRYPLAFGNTVTDPFSGSFTFSTTSGNATGNATTTADGTGTLSLPAGITYTNVLRVKSIQNINMSVSGFPAGTIKQVMYNFYDGSEKFPIFSINYTAMQLTLQSPTVTVNVTGHKNAFPVGINENDFSNTLVSVFPNPGNDFINITLNGEHLQPKKIIVYDQLGKEVLNMGFTERVDITNLKSGVYMLEIISERGTARKKIIRN